MCRSEKKPFLQDQKRPRRDSGEMEQEEDAMSTGNGAGQGGLIKLFIGQIPKTWEEEEIREILEPHGSIRELTILKDKISGTHKGKRETYS